MKPAGRLAADPRWQTARRVTLETLRDDRDSMIPLFDQDPAQAPLWALVLLWALTALAVAAGLYIALG